MRNHFLVAALIVVGIALWSSPVGAQVKGKDAGKNTDEVKGKAVDNAGDQAAAKADDQPEDRQAIQELNEEFAKAFNAGDAAGLAALFSEDARMTDEQGETAEGRAAVEKRLQESFQDTPGIKITLKSDSLRFLSPDVAIEEGSSSTRLPEEEKDGPSSPYTAVYVKKDGHWLHAVVRDHPAQPAEDAAENTGYERLKELEWMVGEWVEENKDAKVFNTCRWAQNKNFLVWEYNIEDKGAHADGGTTWIGWDPLTGQIKSWVFDSNGGHGEATWTRNGDNQWVVKAEGVLGDGRTASATQYVTMLDKERASWTSVDRVAGGEVVPDISEFILARKPPRPKAPAPAASKAR